MEYVDLLNVQLICTLESVCTRNVKFKQNTLILLKLCRQQYNVTKAAHNSNDFGMWLSF